MSVLFTKDGNSVYSYDENLNKIAEKWTSQVKGSIICSDNGILFTRDGNSVYSYDKNLNKIAEKWASQVKGM